VDHEHHACEVEDEVVGDAHGHPHGWSDKTILTNVTLSGDVDCVEVELSRRTV
jgi:hypothetical protein